MRALALLGSIAVMTLLAAPAVADAAIHHDADDRGGSHRAAQGSVTFVLTIRGDIDPEDDFWFALDTVPPGRIIEPTVWICGPPGPWSPVPRCQADLAIVRETGQWPVGTVLRYGLGKGDIGAIPGLGGTVTVAAGAQTRSLTYDYDLGLMPDTASRASEASRSLAGSLGAVLVSGTLLAWILRRDRRVRAP
jgi:hypothetical protein